MPPGRPAPRSGKAAIHRARREDLDELVDLENRCFSGDRMSRRSYAAALANPRAVVLAVRSGARTVGAATLFFRAGSATARLYSIAVDHSMRGHGLGARLLRAMERQARLRDAAAIRLEVSVANKSALALYSKTGYGLIGRVAGYYEDGSDAWRLEKRLTGTRRSGRPAPGRPAP